MKKQICLLTLGCPKNIVDSEYILSSLDNRKFHFTEIVDEADIILLNTCGFLKSSINESFNYIEALQNFKKKKPHLQLIVFGCMVSRLIANSKENAQPGLVLLKEKFPLIDMFFPIVSISEITKFLQSDLSSIRTKLLTSNYYAYLKISDGCDRKCAFCCIPQIKGKYKSNDFNELIKESNLLANNGVKELILIGQETTNYGKDLDNKNNENNNKNFISLLENIANIDKLEWIRIMYSHPNSLNKRILQLMNERKNICKYIDIPLQHISDDVLKNMRRFTTSSKIKKTIEMMRKIVPDIKIRSTFIVGFPEETNQNYKELYSFLQEFELDRVGIFKYSAEVGTIASQNKKQIPEQLKEDRFNELMQLQQKISFKNNKKLLGKKIKVIVESDFNSDFFIGRTEFDAPEVDNGVFIHKKQNKKVEQNKINVGEIYEFNVVNCSEYDLFCR